jgi:hypothetical protein
MEVCGQIPTNFTGEHVQPGVRFGGLPNPRLSAPASTVASPLSARTLFGVKEFAALVRRCERTGKAGAPIGALARLGKAKADDVGRELVSEQVEAAMHMSGMVRRRCCRGTSIQLVAGFLSSAGKFGEHSRGSRLQFSAWLTAVVLSAFLDKTLRINDV